MKGTLQEEVRHLPQGWRGLFENSALHELLLRLEEKVEALRVDEPVYPLEGEVFRCLRYGEPEDIRVVILGQDPYARPKQAMGLSFSVPEGVSLPGSLRNMFQELQREYGGAKRTSGDLTDWASQGVLLLNSILTVSGCGQGRGGGMSHATLGWQTITDAIIQTVSAMSPRCVFMLWGRAAQGKRNLIDARKHLILETSHPSPLSVHRGFLGCGHFRLANVYLSSYDERPISWLGSAS